MKIELTPAESEMVRELARELGHGELDIGQAVEWLEQNLPVVVGRLRELLDRPGVGWVLRSYLSE